MAKTILKVLLITLACLAVLLGLAYAFRNPLATKVTAFMLDRSDDTRCSHPEIRISRSLKTVTLSPFECENFGKGALKAFQAESDVVLTLSGLELTHIYVKRATMDQRDREVPDVKSNLLGDMSNLVGVRDGLLKGMLDASEGFSPGGPVWEADTLVAKRNGKVDSTMKGFRRTYEDGFERQHAERMEGGADFIAMRDFDMRVNKSQGKLSLAVHFGKPKRGEEPDIELKMEAQGLDQKEPQVRMSL